MVGQRTNRPMRRPRVAKSVKMARVNYKFWGNSGVKYARSAPLSLWIGNRQLSKLDRPASDSGSQWRIAWSLANRPSTMRLRQLHNSAELGQLVEKQKAVLRERDLARVGARAATDDRRQGGRIGAVRENGRSGDKPATTQPPATDWIRPRWSASAGSSAGKITFISL
jgi:hypothetical protein